MYINCSTAECSEEKWLHEKYWFWSSVWETFWRSHGVQDRWNQVSGLYSVLSERLTRDTLSSEADSMRSERYEKYFVWYSQWSRSFYSYGASRFMSTETHEKVTLINICFLYEEYLYDESPTYRTLAVF